MTYFDLNWLLFSKPGTNLFIVGETDRHVDILQHDVLDHLMLPTFKPQRGFIRLRNESTVRFLRTEQLDGKTRGYSNVKVVFGDDIKRGSVKNRDIEVTIGVLNEWQVGYEAGEEVPESVIMDMFQLAIERLEQIESGE